MTEISFSSKKGPRSAMEDRLLIETDLLKDGRIELFAVFDGHGGSTVAEFLLQNFAKILRKKIKQASENKDASKQSEPIDYNSCLVNAFADCDNQIDADFFSKQKDNIFYRDSGSTAAVVMIVEKKEFYCANAGDTEAVLKQLDTQKISVITTQHKPCFLHEIKRIEDAGGFVSQFGGISRVNGNLAVSRAFGNCSLTTNDDRKIINAVPSVSQGSWNKDDIMIIASDGLWDVFSYAEALEQVTVFVKEKDFCECANFLTNMAIVERKSNDNVSVIVLRNFL